MQPFLASEQKVYEKAEILSKNSGFSSQKLIHKHKR